MNVIWRVSKYLFRYPWLFGLTMGMAIGSVGLAIAVPAGVETVLKGIQEQSSQDVLAQGVVLLVVLYLGSEFLNALRIYFNNTLEQRVLVDMRRDVHQKLLRLPVSFFDQRKSGDISSRVIEDVANVERALLDGTEIGGKAVVMLVGVTVILFQSNPLLASFVFAPIPVLVVIGYFYAKSSRVVWKRVRESSGELSSLLVEDIAGNRLIQSFGLQQREGRRFEERAQDLRSRTMKAMMRWIIYNPTTTFITRLGYVSVVGIGGSMILSGEEGFGFPQLVKFLLLVGLLYEPLWQLHGINHLIAAGKASGERVFDILDAPVTITDASHPVEFPNGLPEVTFTQVGFQYPERPAVLDNLSLTLKAGKVTALVGHTGAGKSTIASLVMRAYDATAGVIAINGVDIRQISIHALHQSIGHVAQEPFLFEGTVRDNLALAREEASEAEMIDALKGAVAWEFVERLPKGLDTNIGEKGIRLSQGEKQRLTIARVLLRNPPLIILDEATASVDTLTERKIQTALENLMTQRTVLVIAHRLSTIRKADAIICLEQGRIVETGTHDELIKTGGQYAQFWRQQSDFLDECPQKAGSALGAGHPAAFETGDC